MSHTIKPIYKDLDVLPDNPEILIYVINEKKGHIIAGVRGIGKVVLWEGQEVDEHMDDTEIELKERLIYQVLKVD